jgi:hypothetical protein
MKLQKQFVFAAVLIIVAFFSLSVIIRAIWEYENVLWLSILIGGIIGGFVNEIWKSLNGQKITWDYFTLKDKSLVFFNMILMLVIGLYPIKERASIGVSLFVLFIGYLVVWLITYLFGSEMVKAKTLWPKP